MSAQAWAPSSEMPLEASFKLFTEVLAVNISPSASAEVLGPSRAPLGPLALQLLLLEGKGLTVWGKN